MGLVAYKKFLGISPYNVLDGFLIYVLYFLVVLYGGKKKLLESPPAAAWLKVQQGVL